REAGLEAPPPAAPPPLHRRGRAAQPRGDPRLARCPGAPDPRRLRADRDDPARREPARPPYPPRLDGEAVSGPRPACDRRGRRGAAARRGRRTRAARPPAVALPRVLEEPRGDGSVSARRVVLDGRPGETGRRWLPLVRRARRRRHHLGRLPHRPLRGGERAARAPGRGRVGRGGEPRPGAGRDREGVRRAAPGSCARRGAGPRAPRAREAGHGALQVPARDRVRGEPAEDGEREDPPRRAAPAGVAKDGSGRGCLSAYGFTTGCPAALQPFRPSTMTLTSV